MDYGSVYHRITDNFCYALNKDDLIVNIKTGYDVKQVFLHYNDPYAYKLKKNHGKHNMFRKEFVDKKRLKHHIWWSILIKPEYKRCQYFFEIVTDAETWFYFDDGFLSRTEMVDRANSLQYFTFPWMNQADIISVPNWVNETIWYQVFLDRFCNGDEKLNPKEVKPWSNGEVGKFDFYGGDLVGLYNKLDYIEELGITGLYLSPLCESNSYHHYDTIDYYKVDGHLGDECLLKKLVDKAHKKGIRVMFDGVFNHSGPQFKPWLDVIKHGSKSRYYSWFMIQEWPFQSDGLASQNGQYYTFGFVDCMPKLNTNNQEVIDYIIDVCKFWIQTYRIDGIRFDVASEISHECFRQLRRQLKLIQPDIFLLGEIWGDSIQWLQGDQFDSIMNYPLIEAIHQFWFDDTKTKFDLECAINCCYVMYSKTINDVLFNLFDSHDTERLIHRAGSLDIFYQYLVILYTMPGSPCIFYGTEIAIEGAHDPDCRRCMPWEDISCGKYDDCMKVVKELIQLRKTREAFRSQKMYFQNTIENPRLIELVKISEDGKEKIEIYLNCSKSSVILSKTNEALFSLQFDETIGMLQPNGVLIQK